MPAVAFRVRHEFRGREREQRMEGFDVGIHENSICGLLALSQML